MGIHNYLKIFRIEKDINQSEMARLIGVSRQTIHSIETGKYTPSVELALKISKTLELPVEKIFLLEEKSHD